MMQSRFQLTNVQIQKLYHILNLAENCQLHHVLQCQWLNVIFMTIRLINYF